MEIDYLVSHDERYENLKELQDSFRGINELIYE